MEKQQEQALTLPEDVIMHHILPRLPIEPLFRFKVVCKKWYSISSPNFTKLSHLHFSSSSPQFLLSSLWGPPDSDEYEHFVFHMLDYDQYGLKELGLLDDKIERAKRRAKSLYNHTEMNILGSYNGLVCLYLYYHGPRKEKICIWNPTTNDIQDISKAKEMESFFSCDGFGYVSVFDDYAVCAVAYDRHDGKSLYVFSLRKGEWRRVTCSEEYKTALEYALSTLTVDDTMYWVSLDLDFEKCRSTILGFDLVHDRFQQIPMPNTSGYQRAYLKVVQECLSLCCFSEEEQGFDVWKLKQHQDGSGNSWERTLSVVNSVIRYPLEFTINGDKCLIQRKDKLILVELQQDDVDENHPGVLASIQGEFMSIHQHIPSLLSPSKLYKSR